jgi:Tol biopolymer transport system component
MMNTSMKTLISIVVILTLALTARVVRAEVTFGTPTNLGPMVNSSANEGSPHISADGLELYFHSDRPGGYGDADIWVSTRATTDDEWGEAVNLGPVVNSSAAEVAPSISADGLTLYFCDWGAPRPGGQGKSDLWVTTRATKDDAWGEPVNLGPTVNSPEQDGTPVISADGLELYFESDRPGGFGSDDLLVAKRATTQDDWGPPVNPGSTLNSADWEHCPTISSDGLTLFFDLGVPGDLMVTTRATLGDDWGKPVNLGHAESDHYASCISADGATLYFASKWPGGSGGNDIWQMPILPR